MAASRPSRQRPVPMRTLSSSPLPIEDGKYEKPGAKPGFLITTSDFTGILERAKGFEPSTLTLARLCSTPELHPHSKPLFLTPKLGIGATRAYMPNRYRLCNPKL